MSNKPKTMTALLYTVGGLATGLGLFAAFTPTQDYTKEIKEKQGTLSSDVQNQQNETRLLVSKLREAANLKPANKS